MSIEKVREHLKQFGLDNRIQEFDVSSATVETAAVAVGVEPARIAKTLAFKDSDNCMLIVTAGDTKIDNRKFKDLFHFKARMLSHEETFESTGHAVGGVCPFALPLGIKVYLDVSLQRFDTVFPAAGSSASAIELTCTELEQCSGGTWIEVCAIMEPEV